MEKRKGKDEKKGREEEAKSYRLVVNGGERRERDILGRKEREERSEIKMRE